MHNVWTLVKWFVENTKRPLIIILHTILQLQYDKWSQKAKTFSFALISQVRTKVNPSPYELLFGIKL